MSGCYNNYYQARASVATAIAGVISGAVRSPQTITAELERFFIFFFRAVGDIIFWISIFGLFMGTVPCEENPEAVAAIAVALVVFGYGSFRWGFTTGLYKKIIYNYAIFVLIVSLISFIPANVKYYVTGLELYSPFGTSETARAIAKSQRQINVESDKARAEKVLEIGREIAACRKVQSCIDKLDPNRVAFYKQELRKNEENSLRWKISKFFSSPATPAAPTSPAPVLESKKVAAAEPPQPAPAPTPKPQPKPVVVVKTPTQKLSGLREIVIDGKILTANILQADETFRMELSDNTSNTVCITDSSGKGTCTRYSSSGIIISKNDLHVRRDAGHISGWMEGARGRILSFSVL